jgi:hypothetical protein
MPDSKFRFARMVGSALLTLLALILLVAGLASGWIRPHIAETGKTIEGLIRAVCLVVALYVGFKLYRRLHRSLSSKPTSWRAGSNDDSPIPDGDVFQPEGLALRHLQKETPNWLGGHDVNAVICFIELVSNTARRRIRVSETIDFAGYEIRQQVAVEFDLHQAVEEVDGTQTRPNKRPAADDDAAIRDDPKPPVTSFAYLYLPVLQPLKGELVDNFHLSDTAGNSLANLSYDETTKLAAAGLRLLLSRDTVPRESVEQRGDKSAEASHLRSGVEIKALEFLLLEQMARRGRINAEAVADKVERVLNEFANLDERRKVQLRAYVLSLCVAYPIVAIVSGDLVVGHRVLLRYARSKIPSAATKGWKGTVRTGLGLRPHQIAIPVDLALTGGSYHLRINGPSDKYVIERFLRCKHCELLARRNWRGARPTPEKSPRCQHSTSGSGTEDCHFRLPTRRGQSFVHLYMRGYGEVQDPLRGLQLVARFKEVPPGTRAQAVVSAFATTLLVGSIGYMVTHRRETPNSDLATLMLALPAVAASWFSIAGGGAALIGTSALGRLSLLSSGLISISGVVVYLVHEPDHAQLGIAGIGDPFWATLFLASTLNLAYISFRFALRLNFYNRLRARDDIDSSDVKIH